jgi:Rieske Fe-S protein
MSNKTHAPWKRHFPIRQDEDARVSRRELTKVLGFSSLGFLFATFVATARQVWHSAAAGRAAGVPIASVDEVAVGSYKLFRYPTESDPCILVRLSSERFVAFTQSCTHLSCPVHLDADAMQLACPCHKGGFSVEDGRPVSGPPSRPLGEVPVAVRKGQVWTI